MRKKRRFLQCNVFSNLPTKGNGLAVVNDADDLTNEQMQAFAAWTNLSETTFILEPIDSRADYALRIFTPQCEMPFAGHPTIGSCVAWSHWEEMSKGKNKIVQECEIGLVEIHQRGSITAFVAPATEISQMPSNKLKALCRNLSIPEKKVISAAILRNGPTFHVLELADASSVLKLEIPRPVEEIGFIGLFGRCFDKSDTDYEIRMLDSRNAIEDPITGSLNAALAKWLYLQGRLPESLVMAQGQKIGRDGRVYITILDQTKGDILIGGETQILIEGSVLL